MSEALMDTAYRITRENYKVACSATFQTLDAQFASEGFEAVHRSTERGMLLPMTATDLAEKMWARQLSYEKAEEILAQRFNDFSAATRQKALSDANIETR